LNDLSSIAEADKIESKIKSKSPIQLSKGGTNMTLPPENVPHIAL
jgi:hypothetical protein